MSGGVLAAIVCTILLITILVGTWGVLNHIAKKRPNSTIGRKVNACKERALNREQRKLKEKQEK